MKKLRNRNGMGLIEMLLALMAMLVFLFWFVSNAEAGAANRIGGITKQVQSISKDTHTGTGQANPKGGEKQIGDGGQAFIDFFGYVPSEEEINLVFRTAMAEGGNTEPDSGIALIADVIGNRCRNPNFPNTITGVITQKNQFETYANGAIWNYEPTERVKEIVMREIVFGAGNREVLYFTAEGYNEYCIPLFKLGNHYFGK